MKVIRNVPFYREALKKTVNENKIIIYQGALNLDRGLEQMIEAMQFIDQTEFHIYGDGDITDDVAKIGGGLLSKLFGKK